MDCIHSSFKRLKEYCESQDFKGWDPYDGLNSKVLGSLSLLRDLKLFRLLWTQFFKLSPVNLRRIFSVPKEHNPKGLALFLAGYSNIYKATKEKKDKEAIDYLADKLLNMSSKGGYSGYCWGYNFDWQSRAFFIPKFTPNVIVSTFAGNALLDAYELTDNTGYFQASRSICEFIQKDLNKNYDSKGNFCFSYSPIDNSRIFNATLLVSRFLARVYSLTGEEILKDMAKRSMEFCVRHQNVEGSWYYGIEDNQKWIDSFHTGYILEAIYEYQKYTGDEAYAESFKRGLDFYLGNFFTEEGMPKYYVNSIYPIDVHSTAQLIVLLSKAGLLTKKIDLAKKVLTWSIENMQDKKGYFYYQIKKCCRIKIPYMRWSCAWAFYALSCFLKERTLQIQ